MDTHQRILVQVDDKFYTATLIESLGNYVSVEFDTSEFDGAGSSLCRISTKRVVGHAVEDKFVTAILGSNIISFLTSVTTNCELLAKTLTIKDLTRVLVDCTHAYHGESGSPLTDHQYDTMLDVLRQRDPNNILFNSIGAPPTDRKVQLPVHLGSLDKIKPGQVEKWARSRTGPYIVMAKQDGLTLCLEYRANKTAKVYTRGDGTVGQDVSHVLKHLDVPQSLPRSLIVRAEIQMSRTAFKKYASEYANARNLVAGTINRKIASASILADVSVIAYEIVVPRMSKSQQLTQLKELGFTVVRWKKCASLNDQVLTSVLTSMNAGDWDIDGLVVEQDHVFEATTSGNPDHAVAFKMLSQDAVVDSVVTHVEWAVSKDGFLKPVIHINPVQVGGVTISHPTGHNAKYIWDNEIGPGSIVRLTRSGDVIPFITEVVAPAPNGPDMPYVGWEWNATKVDAIATEGGQEQVNQQILTFLRTLEVEDVAIGMIRKFADVGIDSVPKLAAATVDDLLKVDGVQQRTATKVVTNIKTALSNVDVVRFMAASGAFGRGMSITMLSKVMAHGIDVFSIDTDSAFKTALATDGFSETRALAFASGVQKFRKFCAEVPGVTFAGAKPVTSGPLSGKIIVMTGFRDASLERTIQERGGSIGAGVTSNTTILICKDVGSTSSKLMKAKKLGVLFMTPDQFRSTCL